MKEYSFSVSEKFNNYSAYNFLLENGISKEIIQKVKVGGISVNNTLLTNINNTLKSGDIVRITFPIDKNNKYVLPIKTPIKILYEDDYMLAVYKEKSVLTHTSKYNQTPSIDSMVCGYFLPNSFVFRAVNRLDKDTQGILLIAKDMISASFLGECNKRGEIKKTYTAIVVGNFKEKHFFIEKPIKRQSENSIKRICSLDGKYAKTECVVKEKLDNNLTKLEVILHTGRTHQIRVHLASISHPLYADSLYGEKVEGESYYLCASKLEFTHPFLKKKILIEV